MSNRASIFDDRGDHLMTSEGQRHLGADLGTAAVGSSLVHDSDLSPGHAADHRQQVGTHGSVERDGQAVTGRSPATDCRQVQRGVPAHLPPILVSDGIAPTVQLLEPVLPIVRPGVDSANVVPEPHSDGGEVRAEVTRVGVAMVERPSPSHQDSKEPARPRIRRTQSQEVHGFGVQASAEPLELRG